MGVVECGKNRIFYERILNYHNFGSDFLFFLRENIESKSKNRTFVQLEIHGIHGSHGLPWKSMECETLPNACENLQLERPFRMLRRARFFPSVRSKKSSVGWSVGRSISRSFDWSVEIPWDPWNSMEFHGFHGFH